MSRPPSQPPSRRERRAQARAERPAVQRKKIVRRGQPSRPAWQSPLVLTSVGALLIGAAVIFASGGLKLGAPGPLTEPPTSYAGLPVDGESVGSATAPVVLEIFSDFQCPACKSFYALELPSMLTDLVQPGLLRIEAVDIDIIDRAGSTESLEVTAGSVCAADQNKYWPYHDLVFWNQGRENKGDHDRAFIDRVAAAAGLDMTAFATCFARTDIRQPILDATRAAAAAGVSGTPTLRLNGQLLNGIPTYDQLHALVVQAAAQASPTPSAGTPSAAPSGGQSTAPSAAPAAS